MSIEVRNVTKSFDGHAVLRGVSLDVPTGALVALLGPSGCGKTTLLRILAGLEEPDTGEVLHAGEPVTDKSARDRNVGLVFQHYALFRHMTVEDNVAFALSVRKRPRDLVRARVKELLGLVQLEGLERRFPSQLSGGQRQRVALARALAASVSASRSRARSPPSRGCSCSTSRSARSTRASDRSCGAGSAASTTRST